MMARDIAKGLGVSEALVSRLRKRGLPVDDIKAARKWMALRESNQSRRRLVGNHGDVNPADVEADSLEESLPRIRQVEKALGLACARAFKEGRIDEGISLRREHVGATRALFDAETKLLKINEARGKLISIDKALGVVNDSMQAGLLVLRRLPELGRDPEERRRLETFLTAVLEEFKTAAADSVNRAA